MRLSFKNSLSSNLGMSILSTVALFLPVSGNISGASHDFSQSGCDTVQTSGEGIWRRVAGADDLVDRRKSRSRLSSSRPAVIELSVP